MGVGYWRKRIGTGSPVIRYGKGAPIHVRGWATVVWVFFLKKYVKKNHCDHACPHGFDDMHTVTFRFVIKQKTNSQNQASTFVLLLSPKNECGPI